VTRAEVSVLPLRCGPAYELELEAELLLMQQRALGSRKIGDKNGWLNTAQLKLRLSREVLVPTGTPDATLMRGVYGRAWNPRAGKRPTNHNRLSAMVDPWRQDFFEFFGWGAPMPGGYALPSGRADWKHHDGRED
jgi:hypothetical protein